MAKFGCVCGKTLSDSTFPSDVRFRVYSDEEWGDFYELKRIVDIPKPKYDVWRCPDCERVYIFDGNDVILNYVIETDNRK